MKKFLFLLFILIGFNLFAQDKDVPLVLHLKITDAIDPRTNRYSELGFEKAKELEVDYVILELDTYGGALTDADEIRTRILDFEIPV